MKDAEGSKTAEDAPKKEYRTEKRKKVVSKTIDLPVTSRVIGALSRDKLDAAVEQEKTLTNQDSYEAKRLVAKNRYICMYFSNTGCPIWIGWNLKSYCGFIFGARHFSTIKVMSQ